MNEAEIIAKVRLYVADHYDGDWEIAFKAYDGDADGKITLAQVTDFLNDAGLWPHWFTSAVGRRVMSRADANQDGRLTLQELREAIERG